MAKKSTDNMGSAIETIQSLIVAFVFAMIFRGFVVEGFVIPTGSMAPTLRGQHVEVGSRQTGIALPVGLDTQGRPPNAGLLRDAMAGRDQPLTRQAARVSNRRMGDRILVSKWLYPFVEPARWDVVVFKNPAHPEGPHGTYIKRLVGLPGETVWLVDGDVFVREMGSDQFHVARKPRHVREAVWQPVWNSAATPVKQIELARPWAGWPWKVVTGGWQRSGGILRSDSDAPSLLRWNTESYPLDDWNAYNMFAPVAGDLPVSDLRIAATLTPQSEGLMSSLELLVRSHRFTFEVQSGQATITMEPAAAPSNGEGRMETRVSAIIPELTSGVPMRVVAEHVDQTCRLLIDGEEVLSLDYDWTPRQRLEATAGLVNSSMESSELARRRPVEPMLTWSFAGAPVELRSMEVDRDLYYRPAVLTSVSTKHEPLPEFAEQVRPGRPAAATDETSTVMLGPDHFFVLGDNSGRSLDGRLWGAPAPIAAEQVDPAPFVVPRDLLIGKAFVVYFPAPVEGFLDFGRLRFIH